MAVITIIGIGQYGTALACVAAEKGNEIRMAGSPVDDEVVEACRKTGVLETGKANALPWRRFTYENL